MCGWFPGLRSKIQKCIRNCILGKLTDLIKHADWVKLIPQVEYALNKTKHSPTKFTPSELLFGVNQRGDIVYELTEPLDDAVGGSYARNLVYM